MPEVRSAKRLADRLADLAIFLRTYSRDLRGDGWHVSAQQLWNAVNLLQDVERRLRNGDDQNG